MTDAPCLLLDLTTTFLTNIEQELLAHPMVAGVILFARNYESPSQLKQLIEHVHQIKATLPIFVDQEGGRVQRFTQNFPHLPAMQDYGKQYSNHPQDAFEQLHADARPVMQKLRALGVTSNLAPVCDVDHVANPAITGRSFGSSPAVICALADQLIDILRQSQLTATLKHFPGHGAVAEDSHTKLPLDHRAFEDILNQDIMVFVQLFAKADSLMPAHVIYTQVDDQFPASLSPIWLQQILRDQLKYTGLVISDDLTMQALDSYGDVVSRAWQALHAGCDYLCVCNNQQDSIALLDQLPRYLRDSPTTEAFAIASAARKQKFIEACYL